MVHKAIFKLWMCLVLVLLIGVATSAWSQTATSSSSTGKAKGTLCGGIGGLKCPEGQACRYPVNMCNVADLSGTCVKVPATCKKGGPKVCGCDGTTYANQCELLKAGAREAHKGACKKK
jgi:hypothetical protein